MDVLDLSLTVAMFLLIMSTAYVIDGLSTSLGNRKNQQGKEKSKLKEKLQSKIKNNIKLEAKEIIEIGRGFELSSGQSIACLNQLYSNTDVKDEHDIYKGLLEDLNKAKPFEALPDEVRPSLARLTVLCSESQHESDNELLNPIKKVLEEYKQIKIDHDSMKKRSYISYMVAIISLFIGVGGFWYAFSGPSKDFLKDELNKTATQIEQKIDAMQTVQKSDLKK